MPRRAKPHLAMPRRAQPRPAAPGHTGRWCPYLAVPYPAIAVGMAPHRTAATPYAMMSLPRLAWPGPAMPCRTPRRRHAWPRRAKPWCPCHAHAKPLAHPSAPDGSPRMSPAAPRCVSPSLSVLECVDGLHLEAAVVAGHSADDICANPYLGWPANIQPCLGNSCTGPPTPSPYLYCPSRHDHPLVELRHRWCGVSDAR